MNDDDTTTGAQCSHSMQRKPGSPEVFCQRRAAVEVRNRHGRLYYCREHRPMARNPVYCAQPLIYTREVNR